MSIVFELGQRVRMSSTTVKVREGWAPMLTRYDPAPLPTVGGYCTGRPISEGLVIGKRTVVEGKTFYDNEEGATFVPVGGSKRVVWLVAFHLSRKPVMCAPDQLEALT